MSLTERYRRPADLPARLPAFPLRGAILLPRATLQLNVFEPRYLAMVDDALAGQRLIGIIQPGGAEMEAGESPPGKDFPLRRVGCAGRITSYEEVEQARLVIALTGICRFEVVDEVPTAKPYRTLSAAYDRFAGDLTAGLGEERVDREALLQALKAYLEAKNLHADWEAISRSRSEALVNALSVMSPYGPEEKQALLEAADLKARADVLVALAEMELATTGDSGGTLQ
jgi:Lon protease-like protein